MTIVIKGVCGRVDARASISSIMLSSDIITYSRVATRFSAGSQLPMAGNDGVSAAVCQKDKKKLHPCPKLLKLRVILPKYSRFIFLDRRSAGWHTKESELVVCNADVAEN